jgi:hypothetical protein
MSSNGNDRPRRRSQAFSEMAAPEPRRYLVEGLVPESYPTMFYGDWKSVLPYRSVSQTLDVVVVEHLYFFNSPFFELTSPQQLLLVLIPAFLELNLERCVARVTEALPYDTDPISQIRFPETPSHLH